MREEAVARHEKLFRTVGNWRLAIVIAGAALAWWNWYLLPIPVFGLIALMVFHERIYRRIVTEKRGAEYYRTCIARVENRWQNSGARGERFRDPHHPYAEDLDLFGSGSIFQLISSCRTSAGEMTLAHWLLRPSPRHAVAARQQAVGELRGRLDLREDVALLGEDVQAQIHPDTLTRWGAASPVVFPPGARWFTVLLASITVAGCVGYMLQFWPFRPVLAIILVQSILGYWLRPRVHEVLEGVETPSRDLRIFADLLARFEREPVSSPRLVALREELTTDGIPPSQQIARLQKLIEIHDWSHNQFFQPMARLMLWSTQFAIAIERWRVHSGPLIARWLEAVGELEALTSFAGYAYDHPDDVFPEFSEAGPSFDASGIAHPLLPSATAVRNDVRLDEELRLLLVSGSNMSGKSTLLRAVGLNAVLAWAGAPVRAERLTVSEMEIGASIRIMDSLQEGKSRFYAEITRIRQIMDLAYGGPRLLFLLDELLAGTNSHDRRIGAEAVVRTLVEKGAIGLVTTHDLALAQVAEALRPHAANVHFEDHMEDGVIAFDYKMRPGIIHKSNALELMRSVGLEV